MAKGKKEDMKAWNKSSQETEMNFRLLARLAPGKK